MSQNVKFFFTSTKAKYDALLEKNSLALYFITDEETGCNYLYKGDKLIAAGHEASDQFAGLMSAEDKAKLNALTVGGISGLTPIDGTITFEDAEDGGKKIGVAVSTIDGNALVAEKDGLFVPHVTIPRYTIEKQETAAEGFSATYRLKQIVGENVTDVGDAINIGKDMVLQGATLETVSEADVPYPGAAVGDPYIDMVFNDERQSHIYVPVKGLVDTYFAGNGIEIIDNTISVKIAAESHGLVAVDGGALSLVLASAEHDGAMSKEDKIALDNLVALDVENKFATKEELRAVNDALLAIPAPNAEQFTIENGVFNINSFDADKIIYNGKKLSDILLEQEKSYTWEDLDSETSIDLASDDVVSIVENAEDNSVMTLNSGSVNSALNVTSSVTVRGANAGIAQNYNQEV